MRISTENVLFRFYGKSRLRLLTGFQIYVRESVMVCYISTDECNKLRLDITVYKDVKDILVSNIITQGPITLKFLTDDIEQQCKEGEFSLKFITTNTLRFRAVNRSDPDLLRFGKLLVEFKKMKTILSDPFGLMLHELSLRQLCARYRDSLEQARRALLTPERTYRRQPRSPTDLIVPRRPRYAGQTSGTKQPRPSTVAIYKPQPVSAVPSRAIIEEDTPGLRQPRTPSDESPLVSNVPIRVKFEKDTSGLRPTRPPRSDKSPLVSNEPPIRQNAISRFVGDISVQRQPIPSPSMGEKEQPVSTTQPSPIQSTTPKATPSPKRSHLLPFATNLAKKSRVSPVRSQADAHRVHSYEVQLREKGFRNFENTCYMNAALQALFNLQCLTEDMLSTHNAIAGHLDQNGTFRAVCTLLIEKNKPSSHHAFNDYENLLKQVKKAFVLYHPSFRGDGMQDAQEFHMGLVQTMKDEISAALERTAGVHLTNPMEANFKTSLVETKTCLKCGHVVRNEQDSYEIALPVPKTSFFRSLQSALNGYFAEELRKVDCVRCPHPHIKYKKTLEPFPRILVIFLKRYGYADSRVVMDETDVDMSEELIFPEFAEQQMHSQMEHECSRSSDLTQQSLSVPSVLHIGQGDREVTHIKVEDMDRSYHLTSAVCYRGDGRSGHYICYSIDNAKKRYKLFDDAFVTEVAKGEVSLEIRKHGYLFYYQRN